MERSPQHFLSGSWGWVLLMITIGAGVVWVGFMIGDVLT